MQDLKSRSTVQVLEDFHTELGRHFRALHEERRLLSPAAPVFALEHGLGDADLDLLKDAVLSAVCQRFGAAFRQWWLPFVVYAAESGYEYAGGEYWQTFEESTPWWREYGDRDRIRGWFQVFAVEYGGAVPQGAFAEYYTIIAWPITHAVLPVYLQRNLARLLFEFRTGLTATLLEDPGALGARLASRTGSYTERFQLFCQNTALLGIISAALLSGEDGESPYLLRPALHRLVDGLSREHDSRQWLEAARRSAGQIRTRTRGFMPGQRPSPRSPRPERLPAPANPLLLLRRSGDRWLAYAELPDLSSLMSRLPHLSGELRSRRPRIAGAERSFLARGQLLFPGREVRLARWPRPEEPFVSLEHGTDQVNRLIAGQCAVGAGPAWLFRCRASGLAVEVRGKTVRPGSSYVLVAGNAATVPALPWVTETVIDADGVRAFGMTVPETLCESDAAALADAGISVLSGIAIRPAGITASNWDGEGAVEWLAGEPGMIGIHADQAPGACVVTVDGQRDTIPWPDRQRELLLVLDGLSVGTYELSVTLLAGSGKTIAAGSLVITVRDPQVRPDSGTAGEGIRMLADPARPALSDLWDGRATISIDGPSSGQVTLTVTLLSDGGGQLSQIQQDISLPLTTGAWSQTAARIRQDQRFKAAYDDAESARIEVSRSGTGFASLTCDRGFQPLRWRINRQHDGSHVARLIDRTDGTRTAAELFTVSEPLRAIPCPRPDDVAVPSHGGLLRATADDATATILLPTQPNEIMKHDTRPTVRACSNSPDEIVRLATAHLAWATAEQPADPFASRQRDRVLDAITREIASQAGKSYWAALERLLSHAEEPAKYLEDMERCVGQLASHRKLAGRIAHSLWRWSTPGERCKGFADILASTIQGSKVAGHPTAARFLLALADQPGRILTDWSPAEREELLTIVLTSPVLLRAARFAVLGTRALHREQEATTGELG